MKRMIFIQIVLFSFLLSFSQVVHGQTSPKNVWVAIVRLDGNLYPLAQFDGTKWLKNWPDANQEYDRKLNVLSDIPKNWLGPFSNLPSHWGLYVPNESSEAVAVIKPELLDTRDYGKAWGLTTDYHPKQKITWNPGNGDGDPSWESIGLAMVGNAKVEKPVSIDVGTDEGKTVSAFLFSELSRIEKIKKNNIDKFKWHYGLKRAGDNLYRFSMYLKWDECPGYYDDCAMCGWLIRRKDGIFSFLEKSISDADDKDSKDEDLMGTIEVNGKKYFIVENFFYESGTYSILELKNGIFEEIISVDAGSVG